MKAPLFTKELESEYDKFIQKRRVQMLKTVRYRRHEVSMVKRQSGPDKTGH